MFLRIKIKISFVSMVIMKPSHASTHWIFNKNLTVCIVMHSIATLLSTGDLYLLSVWPMLPSSG